MANQYNSKQVEEKIRRFWDKEKIYKFDSKKGNIYSIDTPPPYASAGHLHVGHALSYTQFEIIARIMRMTINPTISSEVFAKTRSWIEGAKTEKSTPSCSTKTTAARAPPNTLASHLRQPAIKHMKPPNATLVYVYSPPTSGRAALSSL